MLVYYKLSGVNAVVALIFNLVILLGMMAYVGAVMTLPGIAGFVLTMGYRRRLERADLRAHQGRDRGRHAGCARRSTPASAASSGRCSTPTSRR
jgi:hypothetical protein